MEWTRSFARLVVAGRWPLLALALLATLLAYGPSRRMEFDRSIENMFPPGDPLLAPYANLKRVFGSSEVVVVAYVDKQLLTADGIARLTELTGKLKQVPGVDTTLGIDDSPLGKPQLFLNFFEGMAIGRDHETTAVLCTLKPQRDSPVDRTETVEQIRKIAQAHDPDSVVVGEPVMVTDGFDYLEEDGWRLGWVTTSLLMLVILAVFRSLRWMLIPVAVVQAALIWTRGLLVFQELRLSMVSSMLTAIVTVVGIANVIHVIVRFRAARDQGMEPKQALIHAGELLWVPIFLACLTDAVGFGALQASAVGPVQSFGVMMALGAMITAVATATILPALALAGSFDADPRHGLAQGALDRMLARIAAGSRARPRVVGLAVLCLAAFSAVGLTRMQIETDFTENFRASSPIVRSYRLVEQRLGGAGVWDVLIPLPPDQEVDEKLLDRVRHLEQRLRREVTLTDADGWPALDAQGNKVPGLTKVVSLADAVDQMPDLPGTGVFSRFGSSKLKVTMLGIKKTVAPFYNAVYAEDPDAKDQYWIRIMLRSREQQPAETKAALIRQVRTICREEFPKSEVTGFFVLLAQLIESLLEDQLKTFALAAGGIFLMMWLAFRSLTLAVVALIPNALPIVVVLGMASWLGFKVNMGTVMIASVSMGLAVDSSIHYLSGFRRYRREGHDFHAAIDLVQQQVGRAMVYANLALIVGFSGLCFSHFVPTIYFGVLVSLAMLGGVLGNLVLLPLLLQTARPLLGGGSGRGD